MDSAPLRSTVSSLFKCILHEHVCIGDARRGGFVEMFGRRRWAFPGGGDSEKWIEFLMICLSARPKESQGISLATALTAKIFTIFPASTKETTKEVARP